MHDGGFRLVQPQSISGYNRGFKTNNATKQPSMLHIFGMITKCLPKFLVHHGEKIFTPLANSPPQPKVKALRREIIIFTSFFLIIFNDPLTEIINDPSLFLNFLPHFSPSQTHSI
jgi:hypothetical protein